MDSDKKKKISRRNFLKGAASTAIAGSAVVTAGCKAKGLLGSSEAVALEFQEYFKK
ncbi:MAG: twin-arginine translocation signal domain-containing protein, partial [Desulfobacteraceae bacterium]|nr:twin-arginine translocation signal domain-containing protein [Desulfobacteraceae bacterium]